MPGRSLNVGDYRFGFNGKESDGEVCGEGNNYSIGARTYDPRVGRWWSVDPKAPEFPTHSPYSGNGNNPVLFTDPNGEQIYLPAQSQYSETAVIVLSLITGYRLELDESVENVPLPDGSPFEGRAIRVKAQLETPSQREVKGFSERLVEVLRIRDIQLPVGLEDIESQNRANDYDFRGLPPNPDAKSLILDGEVFTDASFKFIAHSMLHEISETLSLARNDWDQEPSQYPRDHSSGWRQDLEAVVDGAPEGSSIRNFKYWDAIELEPYQIPKETSENAFLGYQDSEGRVILFNYHINVNGEFDHLDYEFYGPGKYNPAAADSRPDPTEKQ